MEEHIMSVTRYERRARDYVRNLYEDYLYARSKHDRELTNSTFSTYYNGMAMLKAMFPYSTNEEHLETMWEAIYKRENS